MELRNNPEMIKSFIAAAMGEEGDGEDILSFAIVGQRTNMTAYYISNIPDHLFTNYLEFIKKGWDENVQKELAGRDEDPGTE